MLGLTILTTLLAVCIVGAVPWTATPFNPAAIPLAVKSPYLSAWMFQGGGTALNDGWPTFWTGRILGWAGFANVDGVSYLWMGVPGVPNTTFQKAAQKSMQFTSTQSVFVMTAGPVDLTITFLSPIEPSDPVKQSLPFSYYAISAASNDGKAHEVQVYADISGEWFSSDTTLKMNWTSTTSGDVLTHQAFLADQTIFKEVDDRIQHGSIYHSTLNTPGTTYQLGQDTVVRAQFINNSELSNTLDTEFRSIQDRWPILAFAKDLGSVTNPSDPAVFSIGHVRDPAIQYIIVNTVIQQRSLYFWTLYPTVDDAIKAFLNDYAEAKERASVFDSQVNSDASGISGDYAAIVALSMRQALATTEITVAKSSDGSFDTSNALMFMREMWSMQVSTVDAIYAAWPLFLYVNPPSFARQLLLPMLQYQFTGQYPNAWSLHDMGTNYPVANGHNDGRDNFMGVEESSNMIIMMLSYTQQSKDTSLIKTYQGLLDQWGQYLVANALIPGANQPDTDEYAGLLANKSNLAIKGIIAIKALSQIEDLLGDRAASSNYSAIADSYAKQWQSLAVASDNAHLVLSYGDDYNWGLMYNLYADRLLGTNVVPSSIYGMQTNWYSGKSNAFGIALDSRHSYTKTDWAIWTAAISTSNYVRDQFISGVVNYASSGLNSWPFSDMYDVTNGSMAQVGPKAFVARANVGGHLALLAMPSFTTTSPTSPVSSSSSAGPGTNGAKSSWSTELGAGGVVGVGFALLGVVLGGMLVM